MKEILKYLRQLNSLTQDEVAKKLENKFQTGDIVLALGAGSIVKLTQMICITKRYFVTKSKAGR